MASSLRVRALLAVLAAGAIALSVAGAASAADVDPNDGQWYIKQYQINEFHAQGIDGTGVKVAVIDSAINTAVPELQGADIQVQEPSLCHAADGSDMPADSADPALGFHGTNMVAYIVGNGTGYEGQTGITGIAPKAKILFYSMGLPSTGCVSASGETEVGPVYDEMVSTAIIDATDQGADVISMSFGKPIADIDGAIAYALRHGVIVVAGLQNQESPDDIIANLDGYPASSNGVLSVGAFGPDSHTIINGHGKYSTTPIVDVVAPGEQILNRGDGSDWHAQLVWKGNSDATAITSGNLALAIQKYPNATANQILQSLIRNTGSQPHELLRDDTIGYGHLDTISFLAADPTQYEDVNPLAATLGKDDAGLSYDKIYGDQSEASKPAELILGNSKGVATGGGATENDASSSPNLLLFVAGGVGLLLLIVGIVVAVVASKRRRSKRLERRDGESRVPSAVTSADVSARSTQAPAGWYDQGNGTQRYWNGTAWTAHVAPSAGAQAPVVEQAPRAQAYNPFEVP